MSLARFIMSSHHLHIETGRWKRPEPTPIERRYCFNCLGKVEDEYHMLFECGVYEDLRKTLIPRYYRNRPSMLKLTQLFNSNSKKEIKGLAKFIHNAFKIRDNTT